MMTKILTTLDIGFRVILILIDVYLIIFILFRLLFKFIS